MIYKIRYQLSPAYGESIIDDILIIEATSADEAIRDAAVLLSEEYPDSILLEIECVGVREA